MKTGRDQRVQTFLLAAILTHPSAFDWYRPKPFDSGYQRPEVGGDILVSGLGKAFGSLVAFHIGQEAKEYGPLVRWIKRSRFNLIEWSERKTVQLARKYGYVGLALALCVPFFPDTISI